MITLMLVVSSAKGRRTLAFATWLIALSWLASTMMVAAQALPGVYAEAIGLSAA
jgi:hypothetical protein